MKKKVFSYIVYTLVCGMCSACGMKGKLSPEAADRYPQKYPNEEQQKCK